jgi:hypothetical protein
MRATLLRAGALAMMVVAFAPAAGAAETQFGAAAATADRERADTVHAQQLRADLGFDASAKTVAAAAADALAFPDMTWGIPLSGAEAAEMVRRVDVWNAVLPAVDQAASDPAWAGWYLDNADGGTPVLLFAADPSAKAAVLPLPAKTRVRVEQVRRSLAELESERAQLLASETELAAEGVILTGIGIDVRNNRLSIAIDGSTVSARAAIAPRLGADPAIRSEAAAGSDACPATGCAPIKGGIGMTDLGGDWPCTIGYLGRRTDTNPDRLVVVTAGHCVHFGSGNDPWKHGSTNIGNSYTAIDGWYGHSDADVGLVSTSLLTSLPSVRNALLVDESPVTVLKIQELRTYSQQPVGLTVCRMGRTTGRQCGVIQDADETKKSEVGSKYVWIDHTIVYKRDAVGGDSGGPVFITDQDTPTSTPWAILLGTHVHSFPVENSINPTGQGWYSPQDRGRTVMSGLGATVVPCTGSTCGLP